ncbi:MAG: GPW/gp25 family protein [Oligoflexus sp.]
MAMSLKPESLGKEIRGLEELRQSVERIITTPYGSRVTNREAGSKVYLYLDAPMNRELDITYEIIDAIERQEPRVQILSVRVQKGIDGQLVIEFQGADKRTGELFNGNTEFQGGLQR